MKRYLLKVHVTISSRMHRKYKYDGYECNDRTLQQNNKDFKVSDVVLSNTMPSERAVVVNICNTSITRDAVIGQRRTDDVALIANTHP